VAGLGLILYRREIRYDPTTRQAAFSHAVLGIRFGMRVQTLDAGAYVSLAPGRGTDAGMFGPVVYWKYIPAYEVRLTLASGRFEKLMASRDFPVAWRLAIQLARTVETAIWDETDPTGRALSAAEAQQPLPRPADCEIDFEQVAGETRFVFQGGRSVGRLRGMAVLLALIGGLLLFGAAWGGLFGRRKRIPHDELVDVRLTGNRIQVLGRHAVIEVGERLNVASRQWMADTLKRVLRHAATRGAEEGP